MEKGGGADEDLQPEAFWVRTVHGSAGGLEAMARSAGGF